MSHISIGVGRDRQQSTSTLRAESIETARLEAYRQTLDGFRGNPEFGHELNWDSSQWDTVNAVADTAMAAAESTTAEWWDARYSL